MAAHAQVLRFILPRRENVQDVLQEVIALEQRVAKQRTKLQFALYVNKMH